MARHEFRARQTAGGAGFGPFQGRRDAQQGVAARGRDHAGAHQGDALAGKDINLCANVPLTARDVVEELARHTGRDLHFHPRSLYLSQLMEIGKWLVKKAGRRPGVTFPSFRDLKSRGLARPYKSDLSRSVLDWKPLEDRETFLEKAIRVYR